MVYILKDMILKAEEVEKLLNRSLEYFNIVMRTRQYELRVQLPCVKALRQEWADVMRLNRGLVALPRSL